MKKTLFAIMTALALVSCSTDELGGGATSGKGGVQLVVETEDFTQVNTRADIQENEIEDLTVLEFKDGTLVKKIELDKDGNDFANGVSLSGDNSLVNLNASAKGSSDNNLIFVIANAKATDNSISLTEGTSTFDDLKNLKFTFNKDKANLLMSGAYYGGIENGVTSKVIVNLSRCVAKINFTLNTTNFIVNGEHPADLTVSKVTLCNVPTDIVPYPCDNRPSLPTGENAGVWPDASNVVPFPTVAEMESYSNNNYDFKNETPTKVENHYVLYMPENARGSFDDKVSQNKEKHPTTFDTNVTDESTDKVYSYILLELNYSLSNGAMKTAKYRIYLGGNSTGDMNLLRNTQYNVTTNVNGANTIDTRISVEDRGAFKQLTGKAANCYMIDMSTVGEDETMRLTFPLDQVKKGWEKIKGYDNTQTNFYNSLDDVIKSDDWEIVTLWKTWEGSSNVTGTKAVNFSESDPMATLTIPHDAANGNNAVVMMVDKNDHSKIYWSWHLWFTDYDPNKTNDAERKGQIHQYFGDAFHNGNKYVNKFMMDRNLGATITGVTGPIDQPATTEEAVKYYGLFYQFGRKDPFVGSGNGSTVKVKLYDATGKDYTQGVAGISTLANSFQKPGTFFIAPNSPCDWTYPQRSGLWSEDDASTGDEVAKSPFDPCPAGWRVPTGSATASKNPWAGFGNGTVGTVVEGNWSGFAFQPVKTGQIGTAGRMYKYDGVQAWYPTSGFLGNDRGTLNAVGTAGYTWSATSYDQNSYYIGSSDEAFRFYLNYRGYGLSVRCIQE